MKAIRVIIMLPGKSPTVETIEDSVESMQEIVGGYFEHHRIDAGGTVVDLYCNEMGKERDLPPNRYIEYLDDVVAGPILLSSAAWSSTGDMVSFTDDEIARLLPLVNVWPMAVRMVIDTETENQILSIGDEFLPECARRVRDGGEPTDEYRAWLANQVIQMRRETD